MSSRTAKLLGVIFAVLAVAVFFGVRSAPTSVAARSAAVAVPVPVVEVMPVAGTVSTAPTAAMHSAQPATAATHSVEPATAATHSAEPATAATQSADPAPAATPARTETVVLAGGCFWGVQGVYQHVKGVTMAESGYAGGARDTADYEVVSTGTTGHAESVRVTFDPAQVTLGQILQIFFSVVHDPTELDRQGPDTGTQYRSEIFAQNADQQQVAADYVAQLTKQDVFPSPIVTKIEINTSFYPAERYHQDFLTLNPTYPYIEINDIPKVHDLQRLFPALYSDQPVLVLPGDHH